MTRSAAVPPAGGDGAEHQENVDVPGGAAAAASGKHEHSDSGPHQQTRAVLNRLARLEGHVGGVRKMVAAGRSCPDVLVQLAAVRAAVDKAARLVLEDHIASCLREAARNGTADEEWTRLKQALDRYLS